ncbi:UDP-glucose 6-dehydrogenase [Candidatus Altiarchaeales archaeon WOR_SM1_SCG]|nr:UDP-glucose 6-dehydrogenase [Candidatus Altiarchaeales archaeon WOR_SM1_SCG]
MRISVIGAGYVGLITGACLADLDNEVYCVDVIEEKVRKINNKIPPIYEEGLSELLKKNIGKNLTASTDAENAVKNSDITFIAVGTPGGDDGSINLTYIEESAKSIGKALKEKNNYHVVVVKSTVIPGTTDSVVIPILEEFSGKTAGRDFGVCMNPEFLREGKAIYDFMNPDRIVIGELNKKSGDMIRELYKNFDCPIMRTSLRAAEMIKYASNAFLATKISFINEIANICERTGVDVTEVAKGIGLDRRINPNFLNAGVGFGGSCFPKDVNALVREAKEENYEPVLLNAVLDLNEKQKMRAYEIARDIMDLSGKKIAVLGLAFKEGTDDVRYAPAIPTIEKLLKSGAKIFVYDPEAMENAKGIFGNKVKYCKSIDSALENADLCIIMTEWNDFKEIYDKFSLMKNKIVVDGRRILDPVKAENQGMEYYGIGFPGKQYTR